MHRIILIAHNLRSTHNVGSLLRTAEGLGVERVFLTGYTPYPGMPDDDRLPHLATKIDKAIKKTALGAEVSQPWERQEYLLPLLDRLRQDDWTIAALEQAEDSILLPDFTTPVRIALIVGREVEGIEQEVLNAADHILEIPMFGQKESFNVVQAAAMALYQFRFRA